MEDLKSKSWFFWLADFLHLGKEGLEPSPVFTERILSPQRLPFRHIPLKK
jgi:hypothetical protein